MDSVSKRIIVELVRKTSKFFNDLADQLSQIGVKRERSKKKHNKSGEQIKQLRGENQEDPVGDVEDLRKAIASSWNELNKSEKKKWRKRAEEEKNQVKLLEDSGDSGKEPIDLRSLSSVENLSESSSDSDSDSDSEVSEDEKKKKKKNKKKDKKKNKKGDKKKDKKKDKGKKKKKKDKKGKKKSKSDSEDEGKPKKKHKKS